MINWKDKIHKKALTLKHHQLRLLAVSHRKVMEKPTQIRISQLLSQSSQNLHHRKLTARRVRRVHNSNRLERHRAPQQLLDPLMVDHHHDLLEETLQEAQVDRAVQAGKVAQVDKVVQVEVEGNMEEDEFSNETKKF